VSGGGVAGFQTAGSRQVVDSLQRGGDACGCLPRRRGSRLKYQRTQRIRAKPPSGKRPWSKREKKRTVASYNTSEFKKGLKVQIDGDPYILFECNFVKPGKGQALYKCKLRNLLRGTVLDRTYKSGDSLDAADIATIDAQFLYKQGDMFVFMDNDTYEQYELSKEQVDDSWKWFKEGTVCSMLLYNGNPISMEPPNHMVLRVEYGEPSTRGNTATNLTKPVKLETGAEVIVPAFIDQGDLLKIDTRTGEYLERVKE
jgi:elongation factor P